MQSQHLLGRPGLGVTLAEDQCLKVVSVKEQGQAIQKGRLFSFGFLGF